MVACLFRHLFCVPRRLRRCGLQAGARFHERRFDSRPPAGPVTFKDYAYNEVRYRMLSHSAPEEAERLLKLTQAEIKDQWKRYEALAAVPAVTPA